MSAALFETAVGLSYTLAVIDWMPQVTSWWLLRLRRYCFHFLTKLRFWHRVIARAFCHLWTTC